MQVLVSGLKPVSLLPVMERQTIGLVGMSACLAKLLLLGHIIMMIYALLTPIVIPVLPIFFILT